jgi:hypothetical protein
MNNQINNSNNYNSQLVRTPLQPKSVNKNIVNDSSVKNTPIKFPVFEKFNNSHNLLNAIQESTSEIQLNEKKFEKEMKNNFYFSEEKNSLTSPSYKDIIQLSEKEENYNKNKNNYNYNKTPCIEILPMDDYPFSTDEKSNTKYKLNGIFHSNNPQSPESPESPTSLKIKKALDFFDNENYFHLNIRDVNNKSKIDKFIHEDLCFVEDIE